jgi:3-oxoacyl-[acyl-carrier protein] reductase
MRAMDLGLAGRRALVTGASRGIGRAIAQALIAEGATVAISSSSRERIEQTAAEIGAQPFVHDSADLDGAAHLVEQAGPLDILIVNTGGPPASPDTLGHSREEWESAYRSLVLSPMALISAAVPGMCGRRDGRIVNVASSAVREPLPALMLSNTHRSATLAAFKTLSRQLAPDGVTLNTVLPGQIATQRIASLYGSLEAAEQAAAAMIPAGRLGTPEEFAAAVTFLCSRQAAYITGVALLVDGGLTHAI